MPARPGVCGGFVPGLLGGERVPLVSLVEGRGLEDPSFLWYPTTQVDHPLHSTGRVESSRPSVGVTLGPTPVPPSGRCRSPPHWGRTSVDRYRSPPASTRTAPFPSHGVEARPNTTDLRVRVYVASGPPLPPGPRRERWTSRGRHSRVLPPSRVRRGTLVSGVGGINSLGLKVPSNLLFLRHDSAFSHRALLVVRVESLCG